MILEKRYLWLKFLRLAVKILHFFTAEVTNFSGVLQLTQTEGLLYSGAAKFAHTFVFTWRLTVKKLSRDPVISARRRFAVW